MWTNIRLVQREDNDDTKCAQFTPFQLELGNALIETS